MSLDLIEFWKARGPRHYKEFQDLSSEVKSRFTNQENETLKILRKYRFSKILELGCGFGRYTKILSQAFKPEKYVAVDLVKEQIENAKNYVGNDKIDYHCIPIQDFDMDEKFDLVFASEFLMHLNFETIEDVIKKMVSFSSNKIVIVDWYDKTMFGKELRGYCFQHDYQTFFEKNNIKKFKAYPITYPFRTRLLGKYARMRGRRAPPPQAIIEIDV